MALSKQHELHKRRFGRNLGLGIVLACFVALIFGLTVAKVTNEEFTLRPNEIAAEPATAGAD